MPKLTTEVRLSREMSLMDVTLIGVGAMIGAGIFVLTGIASGVAGPALLVTFLLNGLIALLTAMSYAELGSCYHDAGGGYLWVKEGLPRWNGFLSGWMSWFAHAVACSLYALGFGAYFHHLLTSLGIDLPTLGFFGPEKLLAAAIAILFAYINFRGASEAGKVGNLVTTAKIIVLMIFVGFGLSIMAGRPDWKVAFTPFAPNGWQGIVRAMGLTFIAFQGFEVIAQCSEEVKAPRRNIPRATFLSLAIVVPIYLLVAVAALGSVQPGNMTPWAFLATYKETALVEVAQHFFVGGGVMILAGGLVSTMSALNATVYSSSRVAFAMGRDRNFPAIFSRVHPATRTPHWAIAFSLVIVVMMAVSLPIEDVASSADIMFLLLFMQVNLAAIRLRTKRPDLDRGFKIPLFPALPIVAIVLLLALALYMFTYSPRAWIVTASWAAVGLLIYRMFSSKSELDHGRKVRSLERLERRDYRVLVCVSHPDRVASLARLAVAVGQAHNAELIFTHIVDVDEGAPLATGLDEAERARPLLAKAEAEMAEIGLRSRSVITVSHGISRGIVDAAEAEDCNLILLGRKQDPSWLERYGSALTDAALERVPAEVIFLHGDLPAKGVRRIMLPFGENIHTRLALELAPALAEHFGAVLEVVLVLDPDVTEKTRQERQAAVMVTLREACPTATLTTMAHEEVVEAVVQLSGRADLLLMGGRSGSFWEMLAAGSMTEAITHAAKCPVVWVEEYEEGKTLLARLLRRSDAEKVA